MVLTVHLLLAMFLTQELRSFSMKKTQLLWRRALASVSTTKVSRQLLTYSESLKRMDDRWDSRRFKSAHLSLFKSTSSIHWRSQDTEWWRQEHLGKRMCYLKQVYDSIHTSIQEIYPYITTFFSLSFPLPSFLLLFYKFISNLSHFNTFSSSK